MEKENLTRQYGRLNPEVNEEETFARLRDLDVICKASSSNINGGDRQREKLESDVDQNDGRASVEVQPKSLKSSKATHSQLLNLSLELIDIIFAFLSPPDLDRVGCTCRLLHQLSQRDHNWQNHVQSNVPGCKLLSPAPFPTWRKLYRSHDPHWFLTKHKIWFSDYFLTGKLIIVRYNPKNACIEGYRLVAERKSREFEHWEYDNEVIVHSFAPHVKLHLNIPVLELSPNHVPLSCHSSPADSEENQGGKPGRNVSTSSILALHTPANTFRRYVTFELCRSIRTEAYMSVWPPLTIPTSPTKRVRNSSNQKFQGSGHRPTKLSEISDSAFRIRTWVGGMGSGSALHGPLPIPMLAWMQNGLLRSGGRMSEEVDTFATLDPDLYTPTLLKPYRGLWVGDYSAHGCEFLLMHQPDDDVPFDEKEVVQREDETSTEFYFRREEEEIFRGSIQAIKLTGDPNVARGEYTFIADDIGTDGFVRYAQEEKFKGARIVKSRGHVAEAGGGNDKYIESQLIMISPNRLAQYWVGFGHISFYQRIHIDQLLDPANDSEAENSTHGISPGPVYHSMYTL